MSQHCIIGSHAADAAGLLAYSRAVATLGEEVASLPRVVTRQCTLVSWSCLGLSQGTASLCAEIECVRGSFHSFPVIQGACTGGMACSAPRTAASGRCV